MIKRKYRKYGYLIFLPLAIIFSLASESLTYKYFGPITADINFIQISAHIAFPVLAVALAGFLSLLITKAIQRKRDEANEQKE